MMIVNVHQAKSQLSKLLDAVERGEDVIITRRGSGVGRYRIVPAPVADRSKMFGALKGQIEIYFDAPDRVICELLDEYFEYIDRDLCIALTIPTRCCGFCMILHACGVVRSTHCSTRPESWCPRSCYSKSLSRLRSESC